MHNPLNLSIIKRILNYALKCINIQVEILTIPQIILNNSRKTRHATLKTAATTTTQSIIKPCASLFLSQSAANNSHLHQTFIFNARVSAPALVTYRNINPINCRAVTACF